MSSESYTHHRCSSSESLGQRESPGDNQQNREETITERTPLLNAVTNDDDSGSQDGAKVAMFRQELWTLVRFAFPIFGTHTLEYSLLTASAISLGHISTTALAAAALGTMTGSVTGYSLVQGLVSALDTILPSAWTSPQPHLVGLWSQRMAVVLASALIPMYVVWFNAESILLLLKQDPEVAHLASIYLRCLSLGLPAYAFNCISRRYFQSQGLFTVPTRIVMLVAPVNVLMNWLLVWGPEPIRLGFIGAPIATSISYNLISILSVTYGVLYAPKTAWYPLSRRMFTNLPILVRLGLSGIGQTASEWWAWELVALAASLFGPVALASQSVLLITASTTYQAPFALSMATAVRIGNLLGEGNAVRASVAARSAMLLALMIACCTSTMFLVFRHKWAHIFNYDPKVVTTVASIMPILALFQVFDGLASVNGGIMRALGKQFLGALLNVSAYYFLGIPLGVYLAFKQHMNLPGLWVGLTFALIYCSAIGCWVNLRTDWNVQVKKVADRLKEDQHLRVEANGGILPIA